MAVEVTMPRLSDTMEQGTVVAWNVKEGDAVSAGDVLGDIETDKATMELQNFDDGTVAAILLQEGDTVDVGSLILVLAEEGEDPAQIKEQFLSGASASAAQGPDQQAEGAGDGATSSAMATSTNGAANGSTGAVERPDGGRIFASPLARKIAGERGVDLSAIEGTGPGGRIVKKDVEHAPAGSGDSPSAAEVDRPSMPAAPPVAAGFGSAALRDESFKLNNMRKTIARRLAESKSEVPHYYVTVGVEMSELIDLRRALNAQLESQGVKLTVNDFVVRATALAMAEHPFVNASWQHHSGADPTIELMGAVNIGVAIALTHKREGGLVVATIRDADRKGLRQISAETKSLARKARDKGLTIDEMADATFTVSNLGMFGVEHYTAIVNPPNAAILAVGAARKKPIVVEDEQGEDVIAIGQIMQMTLSSDHRVIDGAMAAAYLSTVRELLESPAALLV